MTGQDDALLAIVADSLDDIERTRIAAENRLRHLTRDDLDEDGLKRDLGLPLTVPAVHAQAALVEALQTLEHQAILALKRQVRTHPLGPWIKNTIGVGEKQGARLLAAIGDPYWNSLHNRPRTVSELWAYCGLHVLRTSHVVGAAQESSAGADSTSGQAILVPESTLPAPDQNTTPSSSHPSSDAHTSTAAAGSDIATDQGSNDLQSSRVGGEQAGSSHPKHDAHTWTAAAVDPAGGDPATAPANTHVGDAGVAPRRQRGQKVNWSTTAKSRAFVIAESCIKQARSPYRAVYDDGRVKYLDATHSAPCHRCGPAGKPAAAGTPLSPGHQHARALRLVMKELLKDLWRESRRLHGITDDRHPGGLVPASKPPKAPADTGEFVVPTASLRQHFHHPIPEQVSHAQMRNGENPQEQAS